MSDKLSLNFYGVCISLESDSNGLLENIRRDFSYFVVDEKQADIIISAFNENPSYDQVPNVKASLYQPDYVAYDFGNLRYVDYNGKALTIYDYAKDIGDIYCKNETFLHEITYLLIHSRIGELLDKNGIHRVHALGFTYNGRVVILLLPPGGGKTTLALQLLKNENVKLISEDTPLLTRCLEVLPFPLRLGVSTDVKLDISNRYLRTFDRSKFGSKVLIDIEYFKGKVASVGKPDVVLLGERKPYNEATIYAIPRYGALLPFLSNVVIGLGLPQVMEHIMRVNFNNIVNMAGLAISRSIVSFRTIMNSEVYRFTIGTDTKKNAEVLLRFLDQKKGV